jgi:hypothetical protein
MLKYPQIQLRSRNELKKRLSNKHNQVEIQSLINTCKNKESLWHDHKNSDPKKGKYIRVAEHHSLDRLLKLIDRLLFKPHDKILPPYIYGGLSEKCYLNAAKTLLNYRPNRSLLRIDFQKFYEQIDRNRVFLLLHHKCKCSARLSNYVADLVCVPEGPKNKPSKRYCIARGFATSTRIAIWCTLEFIVKINNLVHKTLKEFHPRIVFYVDDVGITASDVPHEKLEKLYDEIKKIAEEFGMKLNDDKKGIFKSSNIQEHLGIRLGKGKISAGIKTQQKKQKLLRKLKLNPKLFTAYKQLKGITNNEKQIKTTNNKANPPAVRKKTNTPPRKT